MEPVWSQIVGPPERGRRHRRLDRVRRPVDLRPDHRRRATCGRSRPATARTAGSRPIADGAHWGEPVAVANGVVYTVDLTGFLDAFDARTGALLAKRPLALGGTSSPASLSWGGVSVARNTIYAAVGISLARGGLRGRLPPRQPRRRAGRRRRRPSTDVAGGGGGGPAPVPAAGTRDRGRARARPRPPTRPR